MIIYEIYKKTRKGKERITSTESLHEVEDFKEKFKDKIVVEQWKITEKIPQNMGEV